MGGVAGVRVLKKGTDRSVHWSGTSDGCRVVERGQSGQSLFSAEVFVRCSGAVDGRSIFQLLLEIGEELEGFDRAKLIYVEFADAVG